MYTRPIARTLLKKRKKLLLKHFGSVKKMKEAVLDDFTSLGIPSNAALELINKLQES